MSGATIVDKWLHLMFIIDLKRNGLSFGSSIQPVSHRRRLIREGWRQEKRQRAPLKTLGAAAIQRANFEAEGREQRPDGLDRIKGVGETDSSVNVQRAQECVCVCACVCARIHLCIEISPFPRPHPLLISTAPAPTSPSRCALLPLFIKITSEQYFLHLACLWISHAAPRHTQSPRLQQRPLIRLILALRTLVSILLSFDREPRGLVESVGLALYWRHRS